MELDEQTRMELESRAFRTLVSHLRERTDVQNIDLMDLAGFCRNCLSRWYQEAAEAKGIPIDKETAREIVYGMPLQRNGKRSTRTRHDSSESFSGAWKSGIRGPSPSAHPGPRHGHVDLFRSCTGRRRSCSTGRRSVALVHGVAEPTVLRGGRPTGPARSWQDVPHDHDSG